MSGVMVCVSTHLVAVVRIGSLLNTLVFVIKKVQGEGVYIYILILIPGERCVESRTLALAEMLDMRTTIEALGLKFIDIANQQVLWKFYADLVDIFFKQRFYQIPTDFL